MLHYVVIKRNFLVREGPDSVARIRLLYLYLSSTEVIFTFVTEYQLDDSLLFLYAGIFHVFLYLKSKCRKAEKNPNNSFVNPLMTNLL